MSAATALPDIDLSVEAGDWPAESELAALAARALGAAAAALPKAFGRGELSILFTDDAAIATLNGAWRGKPKPTNVLSFPAAAPPGRRAGGPPPALGDIVLADGVVAQEAAAAGLTLADHLTHLLVHGLLHLVGYDHEAEDEAVAMEGLETAILARLGIADPYAGTDPEPHEAAGTHRSGQD